MNTGRRDAYLVEKKLGLSEGDEVFRQALLEDPGYRRACDLHVRLALHADSQHEQDALECLERAVREHAQRVQGELDSEKETSA